MNNANTIPLPSDQDNTCSGKMLYAPASTLRELQTAEAQKYKDTICMYEASPCMQCHSSGRGGINSCTKYRICIRWLGWYQECVERQQRAYLLYRKERDDSPKPIHSRTKVKKYWRYLPPYLEQVETKKGSNQNDNRY